MPIVSANLEHLLERLISEIDIKPKEYNGNSNENVVTWLIVLEEIMINHLVLDDERISFAVSLLGGTALQWFVNLVSRNQRPASWNEFKAHLTSQFQSQRIDSYEIRKMCSSGTSKLDLVHRDIFKSAYVSSTPTQRLYNLSRGNNTHRLM